MATRTIDADVRERIVREFRADAARDFGLGLMQRMYYKLFIAEYYEQGDNYGS